MAEGMKQPSERFSTIFSAFMVFCVMVWMWGLGLFMLWPWQKGGEWLPEFPIVAICTDDSICSVPVGELAQAKLSGKIKSLLPPDETGETAYEQITLTWKRLPNAIQLKASAWNFQTTVRYRLDNDTPVLMEYQEINGKVFLFAIAGALVTTLLLYLRKLRK